MRNPSITQIVRPFLASRKCDYYEWGQYLIFLARFVSNTMMRLGPQLADDNSEALEVRSHFILKFYFSNSNLKIIHERRF